MPQEEVLGTPKSQSNPSLIPAQESSRLETWGRVLPKNTGGADRSGYNQRGGAKDGPTSTGPEYPIQLEHVRVDKISHADGVAQTPSVLSAPNPDSDSEQYGAWGPLVARRNGEEKEK